MPSRPPSPVRLSMMADEVLKLRGRSAEHAVAPTRVEGRDALGQIVTWFYADCQVTFKRVKANGPYRAVEVKPREGAE